MSQEIRRFGRRSHGESKTFNNPLFTDTWDMQEELYGPLTKVELTINGISPYSEFNLCRGCDIWHIGKPKFCYECHKRCRTVDRMGSKAKDLLLKKYQ